MELFDDYIQNLNDENLFDINTKRHSEARSSASISLTWYYCPVQKAIYFMEEILALKFKAVLLLLSWQRY